MSDAVFLTDAQWRILDVVAFHGFGETARRTDCDARTVNGQAVQRLIDLGLLRVTQSHRTWREVQLTNAGRKALR